MIDKKKNNILVVSAHPDDEVLGCGATIARHVAMGDKVQILILGSGITSRKGIGLDKQKKELKNLSICATAACKAVGAHKLILKNFPDNKFDSVPLLDIIHEIEEVVDDLKPNIIYTHHHGDVNIDHRKTSEAIQAVARPMPGSSIERVLAFEIASSTEWNFRRALIFLPNVFVDVSDFFHKKLKAISCYKDELREFPHPRSLDYLTAMSKIRGGQAGVSSAEAFELMRMIEK